MSTATAGRMLSPDDLSPADGAILDLLKEGRVTAPYAAEEADYSLQYVRDVLSRLVEHDHVRKVHTGLYELVSDPREEWVNGLTELSQRFVDEAGLERDRMSVAENFDVGARVLADADAGPEAEGAYLEWWRHKHQRGNNPDRGASRRKAESLLRELEDGDA